MGVTGLWTVVQPCARPIRIETLNKKRLAVDASIWIYQFLKAVRDKEGNALRNSHVVGFFRRICKLLFIGIKPVFVFDGGAPILKRQTVSGRRAKREGRREDAVRTAGKLLAVQMQRRAEEDDRKRRDTRDRPIADQDEEEVPDNLVYVDELQMTAHERQLNRTFKKKDAYHLPNLDVDLADMGAPNDPRIMSHEELEDYARQFHMGEDVNLYDFSKIDFNGPFFVSLPASDRYNILNAARLRSRLRMGYSKEQLDTMFPNRMDFSRFQIERVAERNELTQRLMNINGMNGEDAMFGANNGGRVAGEKGKEYVLVKNDGVEGGWVLGVVSNKRDGGQSKPIDVERLDKAEEPLDDESGWEDEGFEDVPIEGLNRLRKRLRAPSYNDTPFDSEDVRRRRKAVYEAKMKATRMADTEVGHATVSEETDSLFVPQEAGEAGIGGEGMESLFEEVPPPIGEEEDEELNLAIAMSLDDADSREPEDNLALSLAPVRSGPGIDQPLEFNQKNARAGRNIAHLTNARAHQSAPKPFADDSDDDDDLALHATSDNSRSPKHATNSGPKVYGQREPSPPKQSMFQEIQASTSLASTMIPKPLGFDGPLPFESLNLGTSILGKKKMRERMEEKAGGFEKEWEKEKPAQTLPPWFSGDVRDAAAAQRTVEEKQHEGDRPGNNPPPGKEPPVLKHRNTGEVVDLVEPNERPSEFIEVDSSEDGDEHNIIIHEVKPVDPELRMGDVADLNRAKPPISDLSGRNERTRNDQSPSLRSSMYVDPGADLTDEAPIDWSESEAEEERAKTARQIAEPTPASGTLQAQLSKSPSPEFEDVGSPTQPLSSENLPISGVGLIPALSRGQSSVGHDVDNLLGDDEDMYSDPEEEDLMRQLAVEAEEHARFASTLNSKTQLQNAEDYEKELRQLRNQQRKDRRDADEVTHIMITECQQLLKLFGLPYVTAPMEAEAQCAELVHLGSVDGIVTDDSDVFLFGGTRVYKNMFNQAKFVECYLSSDLEKEYSLDRQKLIRIAHLLGSDYTEGLPNVGPVTALEILSEFDTLEHFAEWWGTVQMGQPLSAEDAANPFRRKFRKNATKLFLPTIFPDTRVDHAYLHPEVNKDPSPFQWGVPDLNALRSFLMATIGWSQERTDEVLVPVIKDMNRREDEGTQANITQFYGGSVGVGSKPNGDSGSAFAPRRRGADGKSKRMETALGRLHQQARIRTIGEGETPLEANSQLNVDANVTLTEADGVDKDPKGTKSARKARPRKRAAPQDTPDSGIESNDDDEYTVPKESRKKGKITVAISGKRTKARV